MEQKDARNEIFLDDMVKMSLHRDLHIPIEQWGFINGVNTFIKRVERWDLGCPTCDIERKNANDKR